MAVMKGLQYAAGPFVLEVEDLYVEKKDTPTVPGPE
jgi:hypothetical protein